MSLFGGIDYWKIREALREKLRDRLEGVVYRVLSARDVGLRVGVGTPFIIRDLDTYQPYMFFTGWDDPNGIARRIFVAPIDEDLRVDVSRVKEVASPAMFGVDGLNTVHAMWDDYHEQWVLFSTFYPAQSAGGVVFLDKNLNLVGTQKLVFTQADGAGANLSDGGISPVPLNNKIVLLTAGFDLSRSLWYIPDITARPLPNPTQLNAKGTSVLPMAPTYCAHALDVHQTIQMDQGLVMLSELLQYRNWFIQVFYGPEKDINVGNAMAPFMWVAPISPPLPIHFTDVVGNIGHPHYTNYLREPYLFFARFPTWDQGGPRHYAHDIWAMRINPSEVFNPHGKVLVASGGSVFGLNIYKYPLTLPIPTFGARRMAIYLYGVVSAGTLTIREATSPYHIWAAAGAYVDSAEPVNAGSNKIIWNNPAPYVSLGLNVDFGEWAVVLEP